MTNEMWFLKLLPPSSSAPHQLKANEREKERKREGEEKEVVNEKDRDTTKPRCREVETKEVVIGKEHDKCNCFNPPPPDFTYFLL